MHRGDSNWYDDDRRDYHDYDEKPSSKQDSFNLDSISDDDDVLYLTAPPEAPAEPWTRLTKSLCRYGTSTTIRVMIYLLIIIFSTVL
jgi:hypothetical protein